MELANFDFYLPKEQIAQFPKSDRSSSKLLLVPENNTFYSSSFSEIYKYLRPGDVVVLNDTKVIPARLKVTKISGGKVEILLERIIDNHRALVRLGGATKNLLGKELRLQNGIELTVIAREKDFFVIQSSFETIMDLFLQFGKIPLPPYVKREPDKRDEEYYQTIYGTNLGAVAAPTAGLHITKKFFETCKKNEVKIAFLTLHIGRGTYQPIKTPNIKDHQMHSERFNISESVCKIIREARENGGRVIAVGTTVVRALESLYLQDQNLLPFHGETSIYIKPGFEFSVVDAMVTNFHLPKSSLFVLVCAFGGISRIKQVYDFAVNQNFKFFSYGDAMYLERKKARKR